MFYFRVFMNIHSRDKSLSFYFRFIIGYPPYRQKRMKKVTLASYDLIVRSYELASLSIVSIGGIIPFAPCHKRDDCINGKVFIADCKS